MSSNNGGRNRLAAAWIYTAIGMVLGAIATNLTSSVSLMGDMTLLQEANPVDEMSTPETSSYNENSTTIDETPEAASSFNNQNSSQLQSQQLEFLKIARGYGTDKIAGTTAFQRCRNNNKFCNRDRAGAVEPKCRTLGHYYDSLYQRWLGPYSTQETEPFQFLEIGFFHGSGFDSYSDFLPRAEMHTMEISCIGPGKREDGLWPWGNFASKNKRYDSLRNAHRLHCMDASNYTQLKHIWDVEMNRTNAPPLKVVVDDGSHLSTHMAMSFFFWFPRLAPGGLLFIEDIEPDTQANTFRKQLVPQVISDVHWCGLPSEKGRNNRCFPTIQPLLKSVHCELHHCVFERNDLPAVEYNETFSSPPKNALKASLCNP